MKRATTTDPRERVRMRRDYKAEFLGQLKMAGLPAPVTEFMFHPSRKWRFDYAFVKEKLAVEYQGGVYFDAKSGHSTVRGMENDCIKFSTAASFGWRVMPINAGMVLRGEALKLVEQALKV